MNGHGSITLEMAIRLSIAFDTTPESWLTQQMQYDLWQAEQKRKDLKVERLLAAPLAFLPVANAGNTNRDIISH